MRRSKIKSYHKMLRHLRERCPPLVPVRTRRVALEGLGLCVARWGDQDELLRFDIYIHSGLSWDATWQVLVHEWGHALAWLEGHETVDDHGPEWGLACAHIYRELE